MTRFAAVLLAILTLVGCVTLKAEHVLTGTPRPAYSGEVKIVMEGSPVTRDYEEVAILNAAGKAADATLPAVIHALQAEAANLGCNAVIRVRYDQGANAASATGIAVWMK